MFMSGDEMYRTRHLCMVNEILTTSVGDDVSL
jgi:hypothetical protein